MIMRHFWRYGGLYVKSDCYSVLYTTTLKILCTCSFYTQVQIYQCVCILCCSCLHGLARTNILHKCIAFSVLRTLSLKV